MAEKQEFLFLVISSSNTEVNASVRTGHRHNITDIYIVGSHWARTPNQMKWNEKRDKEKKNWFWFLSWVDAYMSLCHFGTNLKFFFAMVSFFRFNAIDRFSLLGAALAVQCHFIMRTLYFTVSVSILHSFYGPFSGDMQRTASVSLVTKN